ncbi:hypothetical protein IJ21_10310 [Paenibacillus sp. 32O-W]|jgi:hypothetical protein|uniref:Uncharacterized protein n=1 Tax=Paenibacillus cisolokensis TaxID=1658519 RepID=A0ABQ4N461_9BACL|nr:MULTISPECIES: hypothetical protein [Paenibacillus]ALS26440.1 hypothetical protein IJ21_10310 [Paenibacillus sp. 32O-W]GIQ62951.1 hypothetical protein PACILC2_15190 [Paenibacillus cisolokensis]
MTTKTATIQRAGESNGRNVLPLVRWMTAAAWVALIGGLLISLFNLNNFSDTNTALMVGIGFMVGSVHIYVIRTAIHLVHSRAAQSGEDNAGN